MRGQEVRPAPTDHQAKPKVTDVSIAMIRTEGDVTSCSCGRYKHHKRTKIREDWASSHVTRSHRGVAMWM